MDKKSCLCPVSAEIISGFLCWNKEECVEQPYVCTVEQPGHKSRTLQNYPKHLNVFVFLFLYVILQNLRTNLTLLTVG